MVRFALALFLIATPLATQAKVELCNVASQIAGSAASERAAGATQAATVAAITADLQGADADYATAVEHIVAWVRTLPEDQLTDEVAPAYKSACLAQ